MTADQLRDLLICRAKALTEWLAETLEVREGRGIRDITAAKLACVKWFCGEEGSSFHDDDMIALWQTIEDEFISWTDKPDCLQDSLGLSGNPRWEAQEVALVAGLILAEKAVECFESQSHKKQLLAASMLADATEARDYWMQCRGIDRCRNPDNRFVLANTKLQDTENRLWFRGMQSKRGRAGADALHDKPGGSRDKQTQIRDIWATGKYSTRILCAEQEYASIGMSFDTAKKALRNTPDPDPWPAKAGGARKTSISA